MSQKNEMLGSVENRLKEIDGDYKAKLVNEANDLHGKILVKLKDMLPNTKLVTKRVQTTVGVGLQATVQTGLETSYGEKNSALLNSSSISAFSRGLKAVRGFIKKDFFKNVFIKSSNELKNLKIVRKEIEGIFDNKGKYIETEVEYLKKFLLHLYYNARSYGLDGFKELVNRKLRADAKAKSVLTKEDLDNLESDFDSFLHDAELDKVIGKWCLAVYDQLVHEIYLAFKDRKVKEGFAEIPEGLLFSLSQIGTVKESANDKSAEDLYSHFDTSIDAVLNGIDSLGIKTQDIKDIIKLLNESKRHVETIKEKVQKQKKGLEKVNAEAYAAEIVKGTFGDFEKTLEERDKEKADNLDEGKKKEKIEKLFGSYISIITNIQKNAINKIQKSKLEVFNGEYFQKALEEEIKKGLAEVEKRFMELLKKYGVYPNAKHTDTRLDRESIQEKVHQNGNYGQNDESLVVFLKSEDNFGLFYEPLIKAFSIFEYWPMNSFKSELERETKLLTEDDGIVNDNSKKFEERMNTIKKLNDIKNGIEHVKPKFEKKELDELYEKIEKGMKKRAKFALDKLAKEMASSNGVRIADAITKFDTTVDELSKYGINNVIVDKEEQKIGEYTRKLKEQFAAEKFKKIRDGIFKDIDLKNNSGTVIGNDEMKTANDSLYKETVQLFEDMQHTETTSLSVSDPKMEEKTKIVKACLDGLSWNEREMILQRAKTEKNSNITRFFDKNYKAKTMVVEFKSLEAVDSWAKKSHGLANLNAGQLKDILSHAQNEYGSINYTILGRSKRDYLKAVDAYEEIVKKYPNLYNLLKRLPDDSLTKLDGHRSHFAMLMIAGDKIYKSRDTVSKILLLSKDALDEQVVKYMDENGCFSIENYHEWFNLRNRKNFKARMKYGFWSKVDENVQKRVGVLINEGIGKYINNVTTNNGEREKLIEDYISDFQNTDFGNSNGNEEKDDAIVDFIKNLDDLNINGLSEKIVTRIKMAEVVAIRNLSIEAFAENLSEQKQIGSVSLKLLTDFSENISEINDENKNNIISLAGNLFKASAKNLANKEIKNRIGINFLKEFLEAFSKLKEADKSHVAFNRVIKEESGDFPGLLDFITKNASSFDFDDISNFLDVMPSYAEDQKGISASLREFFTGTRNDKNTPIVKFVGVVINKAADVDSDKAIKMLDLLWSKININQENQAIKLIKSLSNNFGDDNESCNFTGLFNKVAKSRKVELEKVCKYVVDEEDANNKMIWLGKDAIKVLVEDNLEKYNLSINDIHRIVQLCSYKDLDSKNGQSKVNGKVEFVKGLLAKNWSLELKNKDNEKIEDKLKYNDNRTQESYKYIKENLKNLLSDGATISPSAMRFMLEASKNAKEEKDKLSLSDILRMTSAHDGMMNPELSGMIVERIGEILIKKENEGKDLDQILRGEGYFNDFILEDQKNHILERLYFKLGSVKMSTKGNDAKVKAVIKWLVKNYSSEYINRYDEFISRFRSENEVAVADKLMKNPHFEKIRHAGAVRLEVMRIFGSFVNERDNGKGQQNTSKGIIDKEIYDAWLAILRVAGDRQVQTNYKELHDEVKDSAGKLGIGDAAESLNRKEKTGVDTEVSLLLDKTQQWLGQILTLGSMAMLERNTSDVIVKHNLKGEHVGFWSFITNRGQNIRNIAAEIKDNSLPLLFKNCFIDTFISENNLKTPMTPEIAAFMSNMFDIQFRKEGSKTAQDIEEKADTARKNKEYSTGEKFAWSAFGIPAGVIAGTIVAFTAIAPTVGLVLGIGAAVALVSALVIFIGLTIHNQRLKKNVQNIGRAAVKAENKYKLSVKRVKGNMFEKFGPSELNGCLATVNKCMKEIGLPNNKGFVFVVPAENKVDKSIEKNIPDNVSVSSENTSNTENNEFSAYGFMEGKEEIEIDLDNYDDQSKDSVLIVEKGNNNIDNRKNDSGNVITDPVRN